MKSAPRPRAEILTIGDELLKGSTLNANARFLGRELTHLGFRVTGQSACPDDFTLLGGCFRACLQRCEVLVLTGGLGPTPDDITREAVAASFGVPLKFSPRQYRLIQGFYRARGRRVPAIVRREAEFPANAEPLENPYGIALGFTIEAPECLVIVLPGVPREMESMFRDLVRPRLQRKFPRLCPKHSLTVKTIGLSEPAIMKRLGKAFFRDAFDFGIYPSPSEAALRLQAERPAVLKRLRNIAKEKLIGHVYAFEDKPLAEVVGGLLRAGKLTAACAESCTGGLVAAEITSCPGASDYFEGGLVTYSSEAKHRDLGVSRELLRREGAVSRAVVRAMAAGVRKRFNTDYAIAVSGIAGPGGGSRDKPVGLVWIAVAGPRGIRIEECRFSGSRELIRIRAVKKCLEMLWRALTGLKASSGR